MKRPWIGGLLMVLGFILVLFGLWHYRSMCLAWEELKMSRVKREYAVLVSLESLEQSEYLVLMGGLADLAACRKWIKENGKEGKTYQSIVLLDSPVTVKVEQVRKATLVEGSQGASAEEGE